MSNGDPEALAEDNIPSPMESPTTNALHREATPSSPVKQSDSDGVTLARAGGAHNFSSKDFNALEIAGGLIHDTSFFSRVGLVAVTVLATIVFGVLIYFFGGSKNAELFFTAYFVEQSLSVDNLFVFLIIFNNFYVDPQYQSRILATGLFAAMPLRAAMILGGVEIVEHAHWVATIFGIILIVSGVKVLREEDDDEDEDLSDSATVKVARALLCGRVSHEFDGGNFLTKKDGHLVATPLLLALVVVELSDLIFALDSIPAVIAVTDDFRYVYSSNVFAICTVRATYSLVAKIVSELDYLQYASGFVLIWVGVNIILGFYGIDVPELVSLAIVLVLLAGGTAVSLWKRGDDDGDDDGDEKADEENGIELGATPELESSKSVDGDDVTASLIP